MEKIIKSLLGEIQKNPYERINLQHFSHKIGYSPYHFHRLFKKETNSTFQKFVEKNRLFFSIRDLLYSNKRIIDIAFQYGFTSHEAYTRAIMKNFQHLPTQIRSYQEFLPYFNKNLTSETNELDEKPYLEYMQPFTFRSFAHKQLGYHLFYDIWMDVLKYMDLIHNSILMAVIDEASTYMAGIKLQPQCNGEFYSGNMYYSVYHYGQIESIKDTYMKMYQHWIPQNGLKVKQGAVLEIYEKHRPVKISIPIERSSNVVC